METKICTKCKKKLPVTIEYFNVGNDRDGLRYWCKSCCIKYRMENTNKKRKYDKEYREKNADRIRKYKKERAKLDKDRKREYDKEYYIDNRHKKLEYQNKYRQSNRGMVSKKKYNQSKKGKLLRKKLCKKYYKNYKLSCTTSEMIRKCLRYNKAGLSWKIFVQYALEELALHLQGTMGLTTKVYLAEFWKYFYGRYYHIDHIRPKASFDKEKLQNPKSKEFKECWSLENLRLLSALENMKKGAKYDFS